MKLYHGTDAFSGQNILQNGINMNIGRKNLDFGHGFYVTPSLLQAKEWAYENLFPCVISIDFNERGLNIKHFKTANREWAEFVVQNRLGLISHVPYDCISGPMADAGISSMSRKYYSGKITFEQAVNAIINSSNGLQWVMLTQNAIKNISNISLVVR